MAGCAGKKPPPGVENQCPPDQPGCQVEVVFTDVGLGERVAWLDGRLSAQQPNANYAFTAAAGETLRLRLSGPPARVTLTMPGGQSTGAGLTSDTLLSTKGKYALRIAASTSADNAYGPFQLELRVIGKP